LTWSVRKPFLRVLAFAAALVVAGLLAVPSTTAAAPSGDDRAIERAARTHGMTAAEVRSELRADSTLRVSSSGRFYYVEPTASEPSGPRLQPQAAAPLGDTFLLHSNPSATKTIYLDFDGTEVSGTQWNVDGLPGDTYPGWSADGTVAFSDGELGTIQEVWRRVLGGDVHVERGVVLGDPALARSSADDDEYGVRVLFSDSDAAHLTLCNRMCGGVAYGGAPAVFNEIDPDDRYEPAWVFPAVLGPDVASAMADAASHEVGHNLELEHDGLGDAEYYDPMSLWGPIMGAPYGSGVTQWSQGSYAGATNPENDTAIIVGVLGFRADEDTGSIAGAPALGAGRGFIHSRADQDVYALGDCTGTVIVAATPAESGANLDIRLQLLDAGGDVVAENDPDAVYDGDFSSSASGLGASITHELTAGADYVRVSGVGREPAWMTTDHYDDYGSLGEYQVTRTGTCGTGEGTVPSAPQAITATPHATLAQVTVTWEAPADPGTSAVSGYQVSYNGGTPVEVDAATLSHAFTGLAANTTYTFSVAAINGSGSGPAATAHARTAAAPSQPVVTHATQTAVTVPKKVKKGKRPTVKVEVSSAGGVPTGSVRITVGKKSVVRTLSGGAATYKAPKQKKVGKVKVTVTYLGTSTFKGSTATRKFKVRR
jgi:hypothetical protein